MGALGKILSLVVDGYGLVNGNVIDNEQLRLPSLCLWLCVMTQSVRQLRLLMISYDQNPSRSLRVHNKSSLLESA